MNHDEAVVAYIKELVPASTAKTVLQKLLYAAELHYISSFGKRLTQYAFKHWDYGPWAPEVDESIAMVQKSGEFSVADYLPDDERVLIQRVVEKYGDIPYGYEDHTGLRNYVYRSLPFLRTDYGQEIDFLSFAGDPDLHRPVIKAPELKKIKERASEHRKLAEQVFTDEGMKAMEEWLKHG